MNKYLSFEAEKLSRVLFFGFLIVFGAIAVWHWSEMSQFVASHYVSSSKQGRMVVMLLAVGAAFAAWIASTGLSLVYDLTTRRGLFEPGGRPLAKSRSGLNFHAGEGTPAYVPISPEGLGPVLHNYHFPTQVRRGILWLLGIILLLPALMGACAINTEYPFTIIGPAGSVLLLYTSYRLFTARPADQTLRIRRGGLEWSRGKDWQAYKWSNIEAIRDWSLVSEGGRTTHGFEIKTSDGRRKAFSDLVRSKELLFPPMGEFVSALVTQHLIARYRGLLNGDQRLDFGPVSLDAERLYCGVRSILLSEIDKIEISGGDCAFFKRGEKGVPFASVAWSQIWNPRVLVRLVGELARL